MKRRAEDPEETVKQLDNELKATPIKTLFNQKVWSKEFEDLLRDLITNSQPYKWGTITELFDDSLLRQVRKEVLSEIAFTKKETDIYKVYQSGDLANLSGLDWDDLSRLPSLYKLRAAIYSQEFRDLVSAVTGCGKLSASKTDMSINTYHKGCHLLTHDDVIGSRRVSFILYMPDPDKIWKANFGGALRLFPAIIPNVPGTDYHSKLVPQFNQMAFFTVQPGLSFHDVEEVREEKHRLSIQGWFHIPQPGEDGFIEGEQEATEARSTLQQLQSKELQEYDFPKPWRYDIPHHELAFYQDFSELSKEDLAYLSEYLNPEYLKPENIVKLCETFEGELVIELQNILKDEYADTLKKTIRDYELNIKAPSNSKEVQFPWKCAIPPHKQRFMYIDGCSPFDIKNISQQNVGPQEQPNFKLLQETTEEGTANYALINLVNLFKSVAYKKWVKLITGLIVTSDSTLVRRFRPGHDFILATTTDKKIARNDEELDVLLESTLNLTPTATNPANWESGEFGGYELCMALKGKDDDEFEEDDDPAIYKLSDANEDSVLFTSQCKWNSLTLMLRDPSVLKFVKYVSINAKGSRWDIVSSYNVKDGEPEENIE